MSKLVKRARSGSDADEINQTYTIRVASEKSREKCTGVRVGAPTATRQEDRRGNKG
jgi:hypothetical protein